MSIHPDQTISPTSTKLPLGGLLALAASGFLTAMLETMPAGILPALSGGLDVSESAAGQMVTVYAIGSIVGAIPIISATMGWPRRRLLVMTLTGYVVTSLFVAASPSFALTLGARFVAGLFAGVLWGIVAGYASRLTPPEHRGRGLTIALSGPPIALAVGTPLGALIAEAIGWRLTFVVMAVLAAAVLAWVFAIVPDFPGQPKGERTSVLTAVRLPGVPAVILASVIFVVAHNVLYTYTSSFARPLGMSVGTVLLTFGVFALIGLWATGVVIDRHLRTLMLTDIVLVAVAMIVLGLAADIPALVYASAAAWGLAFGGAGGAIPQAALTNAAGPAVDAAQSVMVTGWNIGIAGGGVIGGLILSGLGAGALPWGTLALLIPVFLIVLAARRYGFPSSAR